MRIQVREYMDFVRGFVGGASIMTKGFYVVIPFNPPSLEVSSNPKGLSSLFKTQNKSDVHISMQLFEEYRSQIEQRVAMVVQGLSRTGVRAAQLGTEEIIELFYRLFNIGELDRPIPLSELSKEE